MIKLQCHRCEYRWKYRGKLMFASCPSCLSKVKTKIEGEEDGKL